MTHYYMTEKEQQLLKCKFVKVNEWGPLAEDDGVCPSTQMFDFEDALAVCESKEQVKGLISSLEAKEIIFCDPVWDGRGEKLIYFFEHEFCKWVAKGGDYTKKEVAQCS